MSNLVLVAQSSQGGGMSMIIMMVAIFAIMWFFMIKPDPEVPERAHRGHPGSHRRWYLRHSEEH